VSIEWQTEVGEIRTLMVKHARDAFLSEEKLDAEWKKLGYIGRPDLGRAVAEYDAFLAAIAELAPGVEVAELPPDPELSLDSLYPHDASIPTSAGMILCRMGKAARSPEPAAHEGLFRSRGIPILGRIDGRGRVEGGDVVWLDPSTLLVGRGYRTNDEGIRQLRSLLDPLGVSVVVVPLPHYRGPSDVFHLMSILSPVDVDAVVVYSPLMPVPLRELLLERGHRLIEVPDEEFDSQGCNVLAAAPGRCVAVEGNPVTRSRMEAAGIEVRSVRGREICEKGMGGPTCLTRPLERSAPRG